ncbi:HNH endonuclease [Candidatus Kaiserbacteria bacterium]|nr:HNH endonuclease [Candidatus Kaiserbacteria bacterium]
MKKNKERILAEQAEFRRNNPDVMTERNRRYYIANKRKISKRNREYHQRNRARMNRISSKYYAENRDAMREKQREWQEQNPNWRKERYAKHKEEEKRYAKLWIKENPEKRREYDRNKRARRKMAEGTHTADDIKALYEGQGGKCWYCGIDVGDDYHVDHFIPLSKGGSNDVGNLRISCPKCNMQKHAKDPHEWSGRLL